MSEAEEKTRVFYAVGDVYLMQFPEPGPSKWLCNLMGDLDYAYRTALAEASDESLELLLTKIRGEPDGS